MRLIIYLHFRIRLPPLLNFDSFHSAAGYVIDFSGNFPKQILIFFGMCCTKVYSYLSCSYFSSVHQYKNTISYVHDM